jgi:CheY-like chemotaxis protein
VERQPDQPAGHDRQLTSSHDHGGMERAKAPADVQMEDNLTHNPITVAFQENDPDTAGILQSVLSSHGYEPVCLPCTEAVDDIVAQVQPEVVLLDEQLIEVSGDTVLTRLGDNPKTRTIPVLFFTGEALTTEEQKTISDHDVNSASAIPDTFGLIEQIATIVQEPAA